MSVIRERQCGYWRSEGRRERTEVGQQDKGKNLRAKRGGRGIIRHLILLRRLRGGARGGDDDLSSAEVDG